MRQRIMKLQSWIVYKWSASFTILKDIQIIDPFCELSIILSTNIALTKNLWWFLINWHGHMSCVIDLLVWHLWPKWQFNLLITTLSLFCHWNNILKVKGITANYISNSAEERAFKMYNYYTCMHIRMVNFLKEAYHLLTTVCIRSTIQTTIASRLLLMLVYIVVFLIKILVSITMHVANES